MALTERKEKIIKAVIDNYVDSCQPVSSADIQAHDLPMLSTATIRNELAALEEMGYLDQPHTSAGRVPTPAAYQLYVEKLMPKRELTGEELDVVKKYFDDKITEIDDVLRSTAKVISEITNLTGVACFPNVGDAVIESVRIVKLSETTALVVIVTDRGVLKDAIVTVPPEVTESYCKTASDFVTGAFAGHRIEEARNPEPLISRVIDEFKRVCNAVIEILKGYLDGKDRAIVLEGSSRLLEQPEYANVGKAKAVLRLLESKEKLAPVLNNSEIGLTINISQDEEADGSPECAIVTAGLTTHGVNIGKAGVIGPIRMDYSKIVSVLEYIGKTIEELPVADKFKSQERSE